MANNSPTLVMASLSDDQLKKSIDSLVSHVDEAMKKMVQSTNNAVGEMEAKLKSLGSLKIDSGGTNDGGTGRRTQQHEKLTKAVNDASEAVTKETQKLQDLQQSLSGASDREQNFISQKERAANTIAQENDLLSKQQSELAALKTQEQQLSDAHQKDMQTRQQNAAAIEKQTGAVKYYEEEIVSLQARLTSAQAKIDRFYEVQAKARESISSRLHAPSDQFIGYNDYERGKSVYSKTEQDVRSLIKALSELDNADKKHGFGDELRRAYINLTPSQDMANVFKRQQEEISSYIKTLQEAKKGTKGETRANLDNQIAAAKELLTIYKELGNAQNALNKTVQKEGLRDGGNVGGIKRDIEETQKAYDIAKRKLDELTQSSQQSTQASQQKAQIDAQVAAKEKEIAETKGRIAAATKEQSEADKNASQAAKEKANIQSQVANQEKQVAEAKKQLTTATQQHTDAETKSSRATKEKTMTLDQQASAINTVVQSEKKYTDEVLRQAAAIRSSKEWQEKGHVVIGDINYYDKERANVSKPDKQLLLSLEEQIVQAQQKESQEALVAAEADRQKAQAAKEAAQAMRGVSSYDLGIDPNVSAGRQRQIELTRKASQGTEYLRQQVASLLEVEEREVKSVNMTTASYSELSQHLKQLQSAYNKLGADRIKKGEGVDIANEIQRTQRAMQKLQQTMSRPVSLKDAFGGSEKTLDDLAYKMRRLQSYRGGLNFKTQSDEVLRVNQKYAELQKKMDVIMERNQRMIASNNALGRSWNYMKNRLAFYVTVGAGTSFIKQLIDIRSQYEMNEKALGILLDSASRGTRIFNELSQMALVSPYTLIELSNAAKQLTAYDIAAKDVVDTTRRLADMASAVGVPVERLTYALGQIKAYGYLNSRDARMFANAGIPLVKQLADRYSELEGKMVSTADVYDRMKKKAIDYNDVMAVINKMTDEGGKFFDFQAKMAETLKVRLANLTLAWNNMLNDMGKDNQGWFSSGLKGLTTAFKHWRELYRIISTVIVAIGAYKTASMLVGVATSRAVSSTIPAWFRLANIVRTTQGNMALLGLTMRSIPFTAWFTAIATLASYFVLFNNSSDDVKQKLEEIKNAFDGVRKEVETLFADAIKTDNIGTQLTKLRDMLELAETELGVTIPIRLEDVNESNIKQKLKEAKQFIDEYINFSQTFSEAAAGTKFNELMNDFGSKARSTYTNVTESINSVVVALQELSDKGQASKRDIEILNELTSGQKDDESRIEYLQRLIRLYEELGLIGQKKVTPKVSFFGSSEDNIEELEQQQENALDRLGIKNKSVFENMLKDVQGYYSSSSIAAYQFEQQVMRVAEKIDINNIPVEQRTMKLTAAINEEASQNNWNQFEKELARQIANEKFGTTIEISDESKKAAEEDLQAWQRNIQNWAKNNGITFDVSFQTNDTEASYAKRMLQEAKDAKELWETLGRKEKQGTGSKDATTKAYNDYIERRKLAAAAGADLSSLDAKSRKAASKAESELAKALKDELSTIDKVRSIYKDLTKEGMSHANAVERATRGWDETVNAINRVLQKNGLQKLDLSKFAGIENPRELVNILQSQLNTLLKRGAKPTEIKELQTKVNTLEVDADKYDLTKITKGLNNELGKLKDEYELAVELDANPEMGNMFTEMFGLDTTDFPKTIDEYMNRVQQEFDTARKGLNLAAPLDIFTANSEQWYKWGEAVGYSKEQVDDFKKSFDGSVGVAKKWAQDVVKQTQDLQYKLADNNGKIAVEEEKLANLRQRLAQETNEEQRRLLELQIQDQQNAIAKLKEELLQLLPTYQRVFGEVAEHSAYMTRKLAKDYKNMLVEGKNRGLNADNTYSVRDPITGQIARITKERMGKELKNADKELRKTQSTVKKITEAFKKGEDGVVDWVHGLEIVGEELGKLGQFVDVVGNIVDAFSNPNEYNATAEAIHDIATSLQGVSTAAKGIGQIASGDYIGGAISVASGLFSAISTWFDNTDKEILAKIKDSEREVKKLENSYKNLEYAIEQAYGMAEYGARRAAIANRQLQLVELQRQLRLEQSRDSKHRDEDRILELKGQIIDLRNEISQSVDDITNDLLGISSIGDAAEQLVSSMIEAFRQGEDYMKQYDESFEKMIDNMIMKAIVSRVVGDRIEQMWNQVKSVAEQRGAGDQKRIEELTEMLSKAQNIAMDAKTSYEQSLNGGFAQFFTEERKERLDIANKELERIKAQLAQAEKDYAKAVEPTKEDIDSMREMAAGWRDDVKSEFEYWMGAFGIGFGEGADNKQLSNLQQGIAGVSEETASAVEAYLNGISQQAYLRNDLLTQIRDAVVGMDTDIQVATQAQMLLQLQQSYAVQMAIQGILEGWNNPSGQAVRVELVS